MAELRATYRVQMHAGFNLRQAAALIPYWQKLGISHLYTSPWLRARKGSQHGYDLVDPTELNPELGTETDRTAFIKRLYEAGMGLLLDFVPNHMAATAENWRWDDVLTHGPSSKYARWFDIDWRSPDPELRGRVLVPTLGDPRQKVLERGEIQLTAKPEGIRIVYYDHTFPLDPLSLGRVLRFTSEHVMPPPSPSGGEFAEFQKTVRLLRSIPPRNAPEAQRREERRLKWSEAQTRLRRLLTDSEEIGEYVEDLLRDYSAGEGGRERMQNLLDRQVYRLAFWRRAAREINYRRFFDINDLIGVRIGDPEVFEEFHALVFQWIANGEVDALRIDHIDGLEDPTRYLEKLRDRLRQLAPDRKVPIYVEKILGSNESIQQKWPVAGTTGYEFAAAVESIFIDPEGEERIEEGYRRVTKERRAFAQVGERSKRRILRTDLSAYTGRLARALSDIASAEGLSPAVTPQEAVEAITALIAALPVYRTYIDERSDAPIAQEVYILEQAIEKARGALGQTVPPEKAASPDVRSPTGTGNGDNAALALLADVLLMRRHAERSEAERRRRLRFIQGFQQLCVAAAAKGIEDTAFYIHMPLLSRNEVGGEPADTLSDAVPRFHIACAARASQFPASLLTVTTHDTKRGADVRARLDVLSEIPDEWLVRVNRWRKMNRSLKRKVGGKLAPDANTEYLLYQTLFGVWPTQGEPEPQSSHELCERIEQYILKAAREAKRHTSWVDRNEGFEAALSEFVRAALPENGSDFTRDVADLVRLITPYGCLNSAARTLIQFTTPGVPDTYQGDELWNFVLVDPDNRRPVDWEKRDRVLASVASLTGLGEIGLGCDDERLKLFIAQRALQLRARHPELFAATTYQPLEIVGPRAAQVFACARWTGGVVMVAACGRLLASGPDFGNATPIKNAPQNLWEGTRILLPVPLRTSNLHCHLQGRNATLTSGSAATAIELGSLFQAAPLTLLLGQRVMR